MKLHYIHEPAYIAIFEKYVEALKKMKDFIYWQTDQSKANEVIEELETELTHQYRNFADSYISKATNRMREIERDYKQRRQEYSDPQAEMLRRQDFDLEFSLLDKDEVIELLSDPDRRFSTYELNKIKATYPKDFKIQEAVKGLLGDISEPWLNHPEYKIYLEDLGALQPVTSYGLQMVWGLGEEDEYNLFNFDLKNKRANFDQLTQEINEIQTEIQRLKTEKPKDENAGLLKLLNPKKETTYKFEEFDSRIFKDVEGFDPAIEYQYLKERFPEGTEEGGRWFIMRPDFDVMAHYEYLKYKHSQRLAADNVYSYEYQKRLEELRLEEQDKQYKLDN